LRKTQLPNNSTTVITTELDQGGQVSYQNVDIRRCQNDNDFEEAYLVMKELRPNLNYKRFREIARVASQADGYRVYVARVSHHVVAVMGTRILYDYVHGKHLYIDDLVTTQAARSNGLGAKLLKHAEVLAVELGCEGLRLCTGIDNKAAKRFYEREGWQPRAVAYKKILTT
jgi:GNAT superfamily N-acetyltransferase